ncbi:quinoprotein glucose dehydrogenase [Tistlia consotensis]|uniref:Quinoprotein glucose dehydrogenase n=1 Tax=Tistlia consotensis USBA 355 TaxID=560819 RepID=A0A1Y6CTK7_9PROT|nr:glucose/quinate/shikimate family membrane-bound PQQ-dependent dehydrogenase [Tistlia consotensis]SMF76128.1 quinoprotein glucose dehydrogenase [Tistlia consotensis USBA 355]SNS12274.1 quinoprotein glucose dehydrogenase [Tistlia consotensis]
MVLATAIVVLLLGLCLLGGGAWLAWLGGSWYYLIAGLGFLATAALLAKRRRAALWVYALVVAGSLAWALWEVGLDWWQLAPRGDVIALLGLWLLMPWVAGRLRRSAEAPKPSAVSPAGLPLSLAVLASVAVGGYALATGNWGIQGRLPARHDGQALDAGVAPGDWPDYGRTAGGSRYSPLDQITPANVAELQKAWEYHTGDLRGPGDPVETTYEVTPIEIDDTLYLCTPHDIAIALDPVTGKERWRFDPKIEKNGDRQHQTCRGVSYWRSPGVAEGQACRDRIFLPTSDARLIALDAASGQPCPGFGEGGTVNLWAHMPNEQAGFYYSTSPPVVAEGLVVIGGAVNDNVSVHEPSGAIRAYDAETGKLVWNFDAGRPDRTEPLTGDETYTANSPNSWSMLSVDPDLGLVYAPMGNAPPDQFGGDRTPETERFSSSVVALDLETGQVRWVFQTVHHDLWDMDVPAQPQLVDLQRDGRSVPALVQPTKQGEIFVLDRRTGKPLLPVSEEPAPQGAAKGDHAAPTQPVSAISFRPPPLTGRDMWGLTPFDQLACRIAFRRLRYDGRYTPPSTRGSLIYPGNFGAFNWGGVAVDPVRQVIVGMPVQFAFTSRLVPRADDTTNYVSDGKPGLNENYGAPYAADMGPFTSPLGLRVPCHAPPWGTVAGIDLETGEVAWQHRNGTIRDLAPLPLPFGLGVPSLGGPVITAGGLAFASGTLDYYLRAYDVTDGRVLWKARLPAGGQTTPMSYRARDGRQYVLTVAGGHGSTHTKAGDAVIAYALPAS